MTPTNAPAAMDPSGWEDTADIDLTTAVYQDAIEAGVVTVLNPAGWVSGGPLTSATTQAVLSEDPENHGFISDYGHEPAVRDLQTLEVSRVSADLPHAAIWTYFIADIAGPIWLLEKYWHDPLDAETGAEEAVFALDTSTGTLTPLGGRTTDGGGNVIMPPGEFLGASILGSRAYWIDANSLIDDWSLWSAPLDGSGTATVTHERAGLLSRDLCDPDALTFMGDDADGSWVFRITADGAIERFASLSDGSGGYEYGAGVACGETFAATVVEPWDSDGNSVNALGEVIYSLPDRVRLTTPTGTVTFQSDELSNLLAAAVTDTWLLLEQYNGDEWVGSQWAYYIPTGELFRLPSFPDSPARSLRLRSADQLQFGVEAEDLGHDYRRMVLGTLRPPA